MPVTVKTTRIITDQFNGQNLDLSEFVQAFHDWKAAGEAGADDSWEFGKDVPYALPLINGEPNVLRHVHLVPILDHASLDKWASAWTRRSRRTSDRALVYAESANPFTSDERYLLIVVLQEPDAHRIAEMKTPEDKARMMRFADIAERFIFGGDVVA